jgi:hypothetical protein
MLILSSHKRGYFIVISYTYRINIFFKINFITISKLTKYYEYNMKYDKKKKNFFYTGRYRVLR